jgi:hypothetical protein
MSKEKLQCWLVWKGALGWRIAPTYKNTVWSVAQGDPETYLDMALRVGAEHYLVYSLEEAQALANVFNVEVREILQNDKTA